MALKKKTFVLWAVAAIALASFAGGAYFATHIDDFRSAARVTANAAGTEGGTSGRAPNPDSLAVNSIELAEKDIPGVKPEVVADREFPVEKTAIGSIDFNQDMTVQVFTPYPGRIVQLFGQLGDEVKKGQTLFTIDSPDLVQASSTLISAAGVLDLTARNLVRAKTLYETKAWSQQQYEQAVSDQQTAEGNLRASRDAVRIFGKTDAEMDRMIKERKVDPILVVSSPVTGRITAR